VVIFALFVNIFNLEVDFAGLSEGFSGQVVGGYFKYSKKVLRGQVKFGFFSKPNVFGVVILSVFTYSKDI
jgi:hypothetical protein